MADLRNVGRSVKCIKSLTSLSGDVFIKKRFYDVISMHGDPQGAIEKFGINDYMPVECIKTISVLGTDGKEYHLKMKRSLPDYYLYFFDFFEIIEEEDEYKDEDIEWMM